MTGRRGFTLLELMLAMLLAGFILVASMGVFGVINRTERSLSARFDDVQAMAQAHAALRRAMQTMVAGLPPPPEPPRGVNQAEDADPAGDELAEDGQPVEEDGGAAGDDAGQRNADRDERRGSRSGRGSDREKERRESSRERKERLAAANRDRAAERRGEVENDYDGDGMSDFLTPHFYIGPTDPENMGSVEVSAPWTLELVLSQQPLKTLPPSDRPIRGAFEKVPARDGWAIVWQPIDPPGDPVLVIDQLAEVFMAVLPREGAWTDIFEAREIREYPRAVRVVLFANSGATSDWLFEPGVTLGGKNQ